MITLPTHNSDTLDSEISQNSDTLFALTKTSLFWEEEDFAEKIHWFSINIEPKRTYFIIFEKLCYVLNLNIFLPII